MSAPSTLVLTMAAVQRLLDELDRTRDESLGAILAEREKMPAVKQAEADLDLVVNRQLVKDMEPPNGKLAGIAKSSEAFRIAVAARREELARSLPEYGVLVEARNAHWQAGTARERAGVAFSAAKSKAELLAAYLNGVRIE